MNEAGKPEPSASDPGVTDNRPPLAGVVGWPIEHSRSPAIFAHWLAETGIQGSYVRLAISPDDFTEVFCNLHKSGFRGVNVTIPHKVMALALAQEASDAARAIGAANTISFSADGEIFAGNTDGYGFMENLREGAPNWNPGAGTALVLGAGGAARAVIHALLAAEAPVIRLANRTRDKAEKLSKHFGPRVEVVDWAERDAATGDAATIVNTTSLGMTGKPQLEISLADAPTTALVTDIVYAPLETPLLADARARGLATVDGLGMLLHQARPGFRAWFGGLPAVTPALRRAVLQASQPEADTVE